MQHEPAPQEFTRAQRAEWYRWQDAQHSAALLDRVSELTGLDRSEAADALGTVVCIFEQRLSGGEARKMEAELPSIVRQARGECEREGGEYAVPFDRGELFRRVARRMPQGGLATGRVVTGVLAAIREQLSEREARDVGAQLPHDLQVLWDHPAPRQAPVAPLTGLPGRKARTLALSELAAGKPNRSRVTEEQFLQSLASRASVNLDEAEIIATGVLWPLERRIPAAVADALNEELPREFQILLQDAVLHGGDVPDWQLMGYYCFVADQLNQQPQDVVPLVSLVFDTVRETVSPETVRHVGSELPAGLKDVWFGLKWQ